ncbi:putative transcription factor Tesmin family [Medicago truncatula]|uniref:Putative transcription factor Tesmin family n=1 Tax=Medicago truncatula TaxID=3880 RepID=A0A396K8E7_MEDTR|nr:putative transcription factor Tesmin family [Medicago truncatula]
MAALDQNNTIVSNSLEDDSFFDYLDTLSPLNTKKYVGVGATETLNSLGMDNPLFTSLDVTFNNDSIFLTRNNLLYTSNPEVSPEEAPTDSTHAWIDTSQLHDPEISSDDAKYLLELLGKQEPDGTDVQDESITDAVEGGTYNRDGPDCDYNNLISTTQSVTLLPQCTSNSNYKMKTVDPLVFGSKYEIEDNPSEPIAVATDRNQAQDNLANVALMDRNQIKRGDGELARIRRCIQRSCQGYESEMTSMQRNNSDERNAINKNPSDSQKCVLQGNGFYLNALPALNHYEGIENEKMPSQRKPESPSCTYSLNISVRQGHQLSQVPAPMETHLRLSENEDVTKSSVHIPGEDFCQSTPKRTSEVQFKDIKNKKLDQNMKRTMKVHRKDPIDLVSSGSEHVKEEERADFCQSIRKRKRKVNCGCFAAGVYCIGPCSCQDCLNKAINEDKVLQAHRMIEYRNPPVFVPKVITNSDSSPQIVDDSDKAPASNRRRIQCKSRKSSCTNKRCECFKGGVGCSPSCKCQGCKNIYDRKDSEAETKSELEETEASQISRFDMLIFVFDEMINLMFIIAIYSFLCDRP